MRKEIVWIKDPIKNLLVSKKNRACVGHFDCTCDGGPGYKCTDLNKQKSK